MKGHQATVGWYVHSRAYHELTSSFTVIFAILGGVHNYCVQVVGDGVTMNSSWEVSD